MKMKAFPIVVNTRGEKRFSIHGVVYQPLIM